MSTNQPPTTTVAPNWYPDPENPTQQRFWDGAAWTQHIRPAVGPVVPAPTAQLGSSATSQSTSNGLSISAMILGAIAFLIFPPLFGTVGLVLAGVAKGRGEPLANRALLVAGLGLVLGMALGALLLTA